jgi:hypothetical protein
VGAASLAVGAASLAVGLTAGAAPAPVLDRASVTVPSIPLAATSVSPTTSWATLALGHLDDPDNTFWQLFGLSATGHWALRTPPGVASNGGLMTTVGTTSVLSGFGISQDLHFSPLALTTDQGSSWSTGLLPGALARVPDSLAESSGGGSLALLADRGGTVVSNAGDLTTWTTVTTARRLASATARSGCPAARITAVSGAGAVGGVCARVPRAGIFLRSGSEWSLVGPTLPSAGRGPTEVIRLVTTPAGTAALVSAGPRGDATLYSLWSTDGLKTWTVSAGYPLGRAALVSTGSTGTGGFVVASRLAAKGAVRAAESGPAGTSGSAWNVLPALPATVSAVAATPSGGLDALAGRNSTLTVTTLSGGTWVPAQKLSVPVQYGSSS